MTHNPLTIGLFSLGLIAETAASSFVGDVVILNLSVVLATALYFYMMDDIQKVLMKVVNGLRKKKKGKK